MPIRIGTYVFVVLFNVLAAEHVFMATTCPAPRNWIHAPYIGEVRKFNSILINNGDLLSNWVLRSERARRRDVEKMTQNGSTHEDAWALKGKSFTQETLLPWLVNRKFWCRTGSDWLRLLQAASMPETTFALAFTVTLTVSPIFTTREGVSHTKLCATFAASEIEGIVSANGPKRMLSAGRRTAAKDCEHAQQPFAQRRAKHGCQ